MFGLRRKISVTPALLFILVEKFILLKNFRKITLCRENVALSDITIKYALAESASFIGEVRGMGILK